MYRTIIAFNDLQDNERSYRVGETFPRPGLRVSKARLEELSTNNNRMGFPLIEVVDEPKAESDAAQKPKRRTKKG